MTKKTAVAAAVKAAGRGAPAFVFASTAQGAKQLASVDKVLSHSYSRFACKSCDTHVQALASTRPFCITCGSDDQTVVEANVKPVLTEASHLTSLVCACSHHTTVETKVAKAILSGAKSPLHCSACGAGLVLSAAESFDAPEVPPTQTLKDAGTSDNQKAEPALEPDVTKVAAEFDDLPEDINVDLDGNGDEDDLSLDDLEASLDNGEDDGVAGEDDDAEDDLAVDSSSTLITPDTPVLTESPLGGPASELPEDDLTLEPFSVEEDFVPDVPELDASDDVGLVPSVITVSDAEGDPLVDALELDDTELALAFVQANSRVVAMKGHVAVASFAPSSAKNIELLRRPDALVAATVAAVRASGLRAGLKEIGFSISCVKVMSKSAVEAKSKAIQASVAKKAGEDRKILADSMALGAAGLNRGNWKGFANPLRAAVEAELSRAGVAQPKRVAASIFESAGIEYARTLVEVSNRLTRMTAAQRRELTEVLDLTSAISDEVEVEDEDDVRVDVLPVEARFNKPALLRPRVNSTATSVTSASQILSGDAPLNFSV